MTTVHRPELMLEGSSDGSSWFPLDFLYKPNTNYTEPPQFIAPFQPRLDWQMWFAALNANPPNWLVHLVWKLLQGVVEKGEEASSGIDSSTATTNKHSAVWELMNINPKHATPSNPPKLIRITKHLLDYTRLDGCDGGRNKANTHGNNNNKNTKNKISTSNFKNIPRAWWVDTAASSLFRLSIWLIRLCRIS